MKTSAIIIIAVLFSIKAIAQAEDNLIKVQGKAVLCEVPEVMSINVFITSHDSIFSRCSDMLLSNYKQIEKLFVKNGIPQEYLRSYGMHVNERNYWENNERKRDGFVGRISLEIEQSYDVKVLNKILKTLHENSFPVTYNLTFELSDEQKEKLRQKAIEKAIEDAVEKANGIANSLNVKLAKIKDVNFGQTNHRNDLLIYNEEVFCTLDVDNIADDNELGLNPQKLEIKKTIGITWTIEQ